MNWTEYVFFLIVFLITCDLKKKKKKKLSLSCKKKKKIPFFKKSDDIIFDQKLQEKKDTFQVKDIKVIDSNSLYTNTLRDKEMQELSSADLLPIENIQEIRRIIIYAEIFDTNKRY